MRNAFLTSVLLYLLATGFAYPFVAGLTYVWIDIAKPQDLLYSFLNGLPFSMIAAIIALAAYIFSREPKSVRFTGIMAMLSVLAIWITLTTYLADPILGAWTKWDWAIKALAFTIFIPFLFRTRLQIESLLFTIVFSVTTISLSAAAKTLLGGGGYGSLAIMGNGNAGLGESSTLAAVCVMMLPFIHYLYSNTIIFPRNKWFKIVMIGTGAANIITVVGTNARTGLVAAAMLLLLYVFQSKRKLMWCVLIAASFGIFKSMNLEGTAWGERMSTINTYQSDSSAASRVKVWKWTVEYVAEHPLGGGFNVYMLNHIGAVDSAGVIEYLPPNVFGGKAFHSIYFEILGEQGYVGFAIYAAIMSMTFIRLRKINVSVRGRDEQAWAGDLAGRLAQSQLALFSGGLFIGIAYQAYMFYVVAITVALGELILQQSKPIPNVQNKLAAA